MVSARLSLAVLFLIAVGEGACLRSEETTDAFWRSRAVGGGNVADSLRDELSAISGARVLFGHQSVGNNVLDGIEDLATAVGVPVRVEPVARGTGDSASAILHAFIGENGDPRGKIDAFDAIVRGMTGSKPQIALMKLCYSDITPTTDVDSLLADYRSTIDALKRDYPTIAFVHVTVPLTTRWPVRARELVYRLRFPEERGVAASVKRNEYNRGLRAMFATDPIFDLAKAESTKPDGAAATFTSRGVRYQQLFKGYTWDGGHLNDLGRKVVAAELVRTLAAALGQ